MFFLFLMSVSVFRLQIPRFARNDRVCRSKRQSVLLGMTEDFARNDYGTEGDSGPRTRDFCILLKNRLLQKTDVRGPPKKVGTANKANLHCIVDQPITKYTCSRSVGDRVCPMDYLKETRPSEDRAIRHQISGMPASTQARRISAGQMLAWISPIWALRRRSIHSRDWPIPPPIDRGRASDINCLW